MAGDGQIPLESKTGIDLMVNNHQAEYRWFYFIALPLRLYPGLKSNLAAGLSTSWTGSSDSPGSPNNKTNKLKTNIRKFYLFTACDVK